MKKLKFLLAGILFAALVVVIAININLKYGATEDNRDFVLTNLEALAQGEQGDNDCMGTGSVVCGSGVYKVKYTR